MKGAFARGQEAWGIVFEAFAGCKGRGGAGACGIVFGEFAGGKNRVYDFFPTDVRFFCKFEFYVHIHYYF